MRKILSFLALLVVGFAIPQWVQAANPDKLYLYNAGTNPSQLYEASYDDGYFIFDVNFSAKTWFVFSENGGKTTWSDVNSARWSPNGSDDTITNTYATLPSSSGSGKSYYLDGGKHTIIIDWTNKKIKTLDVPSELTIYDTSCNYKASASKDGVYFKFESVEFNDNDYFVLSKNKKTSDASWNDIEASNGRYNPNGTNPEVPSTNPTSFTQSTNGAWKVTGGTGKYDILINWNTMTATVTKVQEQVTYPTLYLYQDTSGWAADALASAESTDGKYTFTVVLTKDMPFTFTTKADGINSWNFGGKTRYYQDTNTNSDFTVSNGSTTTFKATTGNDGKSWKPSADGTYTIEVNTVNETFKVTNFVAATPATVDWNFNGNTKPSEVSLELCNNVGGNLTMTFDESENVWKSAPFTSSGTAVNFIVNGKYNNTTTSFGGAQNDSRGASANDGWFSFNSLYTVTATDNRINYAFWLNDLVSGAKYHIEVKNAASDEGIQFRAVKSESTTPDPDPEIPEGDVTIYFDLSTTNWSSVKAYIYNPTTKTGLITWGQEPDMTLVPNETSLYKYTFTPQEGYTCVIFHGGGEQTPDNVEVVNGHVYSKDGTHIDINLRVVIEQLPVNLPLKPIDFANGKKHYFIVGDRCGEWRLQPEWELKVDGNKATLNNRFMYDGHIAIGVVDNYNDYKVHKFERYCGDTFDFDQTTAETANVRYWGSNNGVSKGSTQHNPENNGLYIKYSTDKDGKPYWNGNGKLIKTITVELSNGAPTKLTLEPATDEEQVQQRVFTLSGSTIYNRMFANSSKQGSYLYHLNGSPDNHFDTTGWQDGWIQYDPVTKKPYVDGNNEYLYLTSFTEDWMSTHPVYFNMAITNGEFQFGHEEITFIDSSLLDTTDDPYAEFYKSIMPRHEIRYWDDAHHEMTDRTENNVATYDYKMNAVNDEWWEPKADWHCFVIKDVWMAGQFKFWSGWGGNARSSQETVDNNDKKKAMWHGPNGGPKIGAGKRQMVEASDVTTGDIANMYNNQKNLDDTNYMTGASDSDKTPKYYNRVILWYNEVDGIDGSFIQFVQGIAGPAIFAQLATNTDANPNKNNWIKYNWYLNGADNDSFKDVKILGYQVRRYRIEYDGDTPEYIFLGYPEGEYVDISAKNLTVGDFSENSTNSAAKEIMSYLDKGNGNTKGFAAGDYRYEITVTYDKLEADGSNTTKQAISNKVTIISSDLVTPEPMAYQIVALNSSSDDSAKTEEEVATANTTLGISGVKRNYVTYSPSTRATIYAFNIETNSDGIELPSDIQKVDRSKTIKYLLENQDKTTWTSDYYVRCLDYDAYEEVLGAYKDGGTITDYDVNPDVEVFEVMNEENTEFQTLGKAGKLVVEGNSYFSMIARRNGRVNGTEFDIRVNYSYQQADVTGRTNVPVENSISIAPVMPMPYNVSYSYVTERAENPILSIDNKYEYGQITVPVAVENNYAAVNYSDAQNVYVTLDESFKPRNLKLQVKFNRPNVAKNIYNNYDINYTASIVNKDEKTLVLGATAQFTDNYMTDAHYGNQHIIEFSGVHPGNDVAPVIKFDKTEYTPNSTTLNVTSVAAPHATGTFGTPLVQETSHEFNANSGDGFGRLYLGKIQRENGTWDWAYKGHTTFKDEKDKMNETDMEPFYYLFEISNTTGDSNVYEFLVPHHQDNCVGNVELDRDGFYVKNENDPLTLTYIAKGFSSDANPTVTVTAIYVFERPFYAMSEEVKEGDDVVVNSVLVNDMKFAQGSFQMPLVRTMSEPANGKHKSVSQDLINGNAGKMPDTGTKIDGTVVYDMNDTYQTTGYNKYVAIKGKSYTYDTSDLVVTGVEEILNGYENDGEAVFYNLQGIQIDTPTTPGVYIRVQGKNATKVVIK